MYSIFWHDAGKVLLYSLVLGTDDSSGSAGGTIGVEHVDRNPIGIALATICFLVVLAGVGVGLAYIIAAGHNEQLSFAHGYPTFVPKS
jgi:hypothetical protein